MTIAITDLLAVEGNVTSPQVLGYRYDAIADKDSSESNGAERNMVEFLQIYGQAIAYGVFIALLLALLFYMIIFRPKATCCSVRLPRRP